MSLATHAASAPSGELLLFLLTIWHPTWATPLRYAEDTIDWTVTAGIEGMITFPSTGFEGEDGGSSEGGVDERAMRVPDQDLVLWRRIEALIGYLDPGSGKPVPIKVMLHKYLSTNLSAPQESVTLDLADPTLQRDRSVSFTAASANVLNRSAPTSTYTLKNAPGLRV